MGICCMAQETHIGALHQPRGLGWGRRWEGVSKGNFCHLNLEVSGQVATIISVLGTGSPCLLVCTRMAFFLTGLTKP